MTDLPIIGRYIYVLVLTINIASAVDQAFQVTYSIPMCLPFQINDNFTGRDGELAEIHNALQSADASTSRRRVVVLHGLGGIGKTQLAIQYAYIHQKDYTSVWWVHAATTQSLSQDFLGIAQQLLSYHITLAAASIKLDNARTAVALGLPPDIVGQNGELNVSRDTTGIVVNAVKSWFAAEDNNRWLLIIDNYDDLGNVNIYDFLHPNSSGSILITSRSRDTRRIGKELEVQEVAEGEALEILRKSAHRDMVSFQKGMHLSLPYLNAFGDQRPLPSLGLVKAPGLEMLKIEKIISGHDNITYSDLFLVDAEKSDAVAISRRVGSLPLALDQAGSYVSAMQISFNQYLHRLESAFAQVTAKRPPAAVWQYRNDTVFSTWEVSFNALGPGAQELLLLLGFFDNESIPEELLPLERLNDGFRIGELSFLLFHLISG